MMPTGKDIAGTALRIFEQTPQPGYIFGTSGQLWTQADQDRITAEKSGNPDYAYSIKYGSKWIGHKVYDCSGLTMRVYAEHGIKLAHGSNSQHKACKTTGPAAEAPVGALVFKLRNGTDYHHVGVYVGSGVVVEAQGTVTGVIESNLSTWHDYGLVPGVDYGASPSPSPSPEPDPGPSPAPSGYLIVDVPNDGTVNLRSSSNGSRVGTLCEGQTVRPIRVSGEWTECEYPASFWIMSKYLRKG